jgi:penicillin-insensitive murein endopeptidase
VTFTAAQRCLLAGGFLLSQLSGCEGCRKKTEPAAVEESDAPTESPRGLRRNPVAEERVGREGLDVVWATSIEDPTLDPYAEGKQEEDGGTHAKAPPRPVLPKGTSQSFSVGQPNAGWLFNGKAMPLKSRYHRVLGHTKRRGWYYGGDELVNALIRAANTVGRKYAGSIMRVGSLSRQDGGSVNPPHGSHQSGRDVDIGLYCTDLDGQPVDPPGFPQFDGRLGANVDSTGRYLFDLPRNWTFVATLLSDARARVQWIFLDTPLKRMLLDYAVRMNASPELIDKAEKVVGRPNNSSPHANHYHVRIYCTQRDMDWGCKDYGPEWTWIKDEREAYDENIKSQVDNIMSGKGDFEPIQPNVEIKPPGGTPKPAKDDQPAYEKENLPTEVEIEL